MKSSAKMVSLTPLDDLFSTEESRADATREKIVEIPLTDLFPFKDHPFKVVDDERMMDTVESIREYGVLVPAIAAHGRAAAMSWWPDTAESAVVS